MKFTDSGKPGPRGERFSPISSFGADPSDAHIEENTPRERTIGDIMSAAKDLSGEQIEQILLHQRKHSLRFGESAVALKLATDDDVIWALSQQFQYPYAPDGRSSHSPELVASVNPFGERAEAFRELRTQLMMGVLGPNEPRRALAVVSPDVGDGKTFMAANLAVAFSQLGVRTLLIDADVRTPRQHTLFRIDSHSGLSSVLSGRSEGSIIRQIKDLPSLYIMPVGVQPPNPLELLQRPAFTVLVHELLSKFDYVIVDTPAVSYGADARVVAAKCGAALAVGRQGKTKLSSLRQLVTAFNKGPATMAGVVMNEW